MASDQLHTPAIHPLGGISAVSENGNIMLGVFEGPHPSITQFILCEEYSIEAFELIVSNLHGVLDAAKRGETFDGSMMPTMVCLDDDTGNG